MNDEVKKLMRELVDYYTNTNKIHEVEEIIKSYLFIFSHKKDFLQSAIQLLDDTEIIKITNTVTSRHYWIINDHINRKNYQVLSSYCPCRDYFDQIQLVGRDHAICKHLVAISLGTSMKRIESRSFNCEDFVKMLSECS